MNDLCGISVVAELKKIGIASLKIEGRMRSANYVRNIVSAYRLVMDDESPAAIREAEQYVLAAMGRRTSSGYFNSPNPQDAVVPYHSGNMGMHLGSFSSIVERSTLLVGKIRLKGDVRKGDRLRLHVEKSGERMAFTLHSFRFQGNDAEEAAGRPDYPDTFVH